MRFLFDSWPPAAPIASAANRFPAGRSGWRRSSHCSGHLVRAWDSSQQQRSLSLRWRTHGGASGTAVVVSPVALPRVPPLLALPVDPHRWGRALARALGIRRWCIVAITDSADLVVVACGLEPPPPCFWCSAPVRVRRVARGRSVAPDDRLVIASSLADLRNAAGAFTLDRSACSNAVYAFGVPDERLFVGVHSVAGGESIVWRRSASGAMVELSRRFAKSETSLFDARPRSFSDTVSAVRGLVRSEIQTVSSCAPPWGVTLSGGLDSALVALQAGRIAAGGPVRLYTHQLASPAFDEFRSGGLSDEVSVARQTALRVRGGVHSAARTPVSGALAPLAARFARATGFPLAHVANIEMILALCFRAQRDGCRGLLHGAAGNATTSRAASAAPGRVSRIWRAVSWVATVGSRGLARSGAVERRMLRAALRHRTRPSVRACVAVRVVPHFRPLPFRISTDSAYGRTVEAWVTEETDVSLHDPLGCTAVQSACDRLPDDFLRWGGVHRAFGRALVSADAPELVRSSPRYGQTADAVLRVQAEYASLVGTWRRRRHVRPSPLVHRVSEWIDPDALLDALYSLDCRSVRDFTCPFRAAVAAGVLWNEAFATWLEWVGNAPAHEPARELEADRA